MVKRISILYNAISLYDDENREVYHGVKVKDIKDKFVRIK